MRRKVSKSIQYTISMYCQVRKIIKLHFNRSPEKERLTFFFFKEVTSLLPKILLCYERKQTNTGWGKIVFSIKLQG